MSSLLFDQCIYRDRFISLDEASAIVGMHEYSILALLLERSFPPPIQAEIDGVTHIGFAESEVLDWEIERINKAEEF